MEYSKIIKEVGRGKNHARDLDEETARALYARMLNGEVPELELGGILIALRIKGEGEAEMIGSRMVPALMESEEEFKATFTQWHTYKLVDDGGRIIGGIRYQYDDGVVEVGRLMVHPNHRQQGLARKLLVFVDEQCSQDRRVLYTCTKSWINIKLYTKMGYKAVREIQDETGLSFVYMEKQ